MTIEITDEMRAAVFAEDDAAFSDVVMQSKIDAYGWALANLDETGKYIRHDVFGSPHADDNTWTVAGFMFFLATLGRAWFGAEGMRVWNMEFHNDVTGARTIVPGYYVYIYPEGVRTSDFRRYVRERVYV